MSHATPQNASLATAPVEDTRLTPGRMAAYGTGDFTVNVVLVGLNVVYVTYFLTQVAGLRPELAGLVQLVGRGVDACTDPAMGRISDLTRWRWGRRRPFFLLGALPFGLCFALLWLTPYDSQAAMFAYYTGLYVLLSVSMTVVAVPYLALMPELARGYDSRTTLNMYRNVGSLLGFGAAAVGIRPAAGCFGGGPAGFALAGACFGVLIAAPWFLVYAASWELPDFQSRRTAMSLREGLALLAAHSSFRRITGLYLCSRISMDIIGAMLILYLTFVIGRSEDFEIVMGLFLVAVLVSLPFWWRVSSHFDKSTLFCVGAIWWLLSFGILLVAEPGWPRWLLIATVPVGAIGFAVVDLMVWSMLGDVVDEDDLVSGERREGIYFGAFMFLRKLGGSLAVAIAVGVIGIVGFAEKQPRQSEAVVTAIRMVTALGPALFLGLSVWIARGYSLSRARHAEIRARLAARDGRT